MKAFWKGFCSLFANFFGHSVFDDEVDEILSRSDKEALEKDIKAIGKDFDKVIETEEKNLK